MKNENVTTTPRQGSISAFKESLRRPMNIMCQEAMERLGRGVKLVPLSKNEAVMIGNDGVRAATSDKVKLNSWLERNQGGGFGVVPEFSNLTALWLPIKTERSSGFAMSTKVSRSAFVVFSALVEDREPIDFGKIIFVDTPQGSMKAGVIAGGVKSGVPNSGIEIIESRKPCPIGGWQYFKTSLTHGQMLINIKWGEHV
jgi:hypothetical protein